jgi:glycosyltransferase involved in cell wall biosynthesis
MSVSSRLCHPHSFGNGPKKKILFVVSSPLTYRAFLLGHITRLALHYDITVAAHFVGSASWPELPGVVYLSMPIQRHISPLADLLSLGALYLHVRRSGYSVVHSVTPKAGLLAMIASSAARVQHRFHTFTGQVWKTKTGLSRFVLKALDKATMRLSTVALADSRSQASFLKAEGFAKPLHVLGDGAICGVDLTRFRPSPIKRSRYRAQINCSEHECLLVFLGRLNRDKGVFDLVEAFQRSSACDSSRLILVGPSENQTEQLIRSRIPSGNTRIILAGETSSPEDVLAACDIFCLPSYREGFGSSVLEAAAVGLPAIVSRIYGLSDAVVDGETGVFHEPGNVDELSRSIDLLVADPLYRQRLGRAARDRVGQRFSESRITSLWLEFYRSEFLRDNR